VAGQTASQPPFDPDSLPPIETITAQTDIRAFLAPGVPPELTRAALRRAWTADPKIRDFIGLAENNWDFNAPDGMAGFGPLELTDEMRRRVIEMVGRGLAPEPGNEFVRPQASSQTARSGAGTPAESERAAVPAPIHQEPTDGGSAQAEPVESGTQRCESGASGERGTRDAATQNNPTKSNNDQVTVTRAHGRALPQ
jgi:hypothetical protein